MKIIIAMLVGIICLLAVATYFDDTKERCASIGSHKTIYTGQQTLCVMEDGSLHVVP